MVHLPYINVLLGKLEQEEGDAELKALARHLHFGFWSAPQEAAVTQEDLAVAGDRLSDLVCTAAAVGDDQTILDVGCGLGGTIARINRHRCGVALHGLNIDSRQLLRAAAICETRPDLHSKVVVSGDNGAGIPPWRVSPRFVT